MPDSEQRTIEFPPGSLSPELLDLLTGGRPLTPPKQIATFTYGEDDQRDCPSCGGVVEAVQLVGAAAADTAAGVTSVSITSDAVTCLPCGCEIRR